MTVQQVSCGARSISPAFSRSDTRSHRLAHTRGELESPRRLRAGKGIATTTDGLREDCGNVEIHLPKSGCARSHREGFGRSKCWPGRCDTDDRNEWHVRGARGCRGCRWRRCHRLRGALLRGNGGPIGRGHHVRARGSRCVGGRRDGSGRICPRCTGGHTRRRGLWARCSEGGWLSNVVHERFGAVLPEEGIRRLEEAYRVPYDAATSRGLSEAVPDLGPGPHRYQSLGHDPILGWIFGYFAKAIAEGKPLREAIPMGNARSSELNSSPLMRWLLQPMPGRCT